MSSSRAISNVSHFTFGSNPKNYTCCICKHEFNDYGNNPQPISQNRKDRCCNKCNETIVRSERFRRHLAGLPVRG